MEDVYSASRDGNSRFIRAWLDNIENDLNEGDDHGFTPLHWASREGHLQVVEMLIARGAKINAKNDGGDTALHLSASHNRKEIVVKLLQNKATVNVMNEHGNTPLHYASFWCYEIICLELISRGATVSQCNKYDETPLDKAKPHLANIMKERAKALGQDLTRKPYEDSAESGSKYSTEFLTLKSRTTGIDPSEIELVEKMGKSHTGEIFKGVWNGLPIVAKKLRVRGYHKRIGLLFNEEYPRLRIFSHPNVLPVVGAVTKPQDLTVVSQYMPYGSLYDIIHEGSSIVIDQIQAIRFAMDVAKGMAYLHTLEPLIPRLNLCSTHVMAINQTSTPTNQNIVQRKAFGPIGVIPHEVQIDEDLTARISMSNARFSFQDHTKYSRPHWMAPEMLQNPPETVDQRSSDMWSFAILLWELSSREVPFAGMSPMEVGMKIALEGLRPSILPGMSSYLSKLVHLAWNADPAKRPRFDQIIPILQKM